MDKCVCGSEEGTNKECERCELIRMGGVLYRLAMRLANRLVELGESPLMTADECGSLVRCSADEMEEFLRSEGVEPEPMIPDNTKEMAYQRMKKKVLSRPNTLVDIIRALEDDVCQE